MREISLDTETTGFDPATGDRIVEIGAVELMGGRAPEAECRGEMAAMGRVWGKSFLWTRVVEDLRFDGYFRR